MKKIIACIVFILFANVNTNAQTTTLFENIKAKQKLAPWIFQNGKFRTDIRDFKETEYLEIDIPHDISYQIDNAFIQKIIVYIKHNLQLTVNVEAKIEYKMTDSNWNAFEPITKSFLDLVSQREKDDNLRKSFNKTYYNNLIFKNPVEKAENYNSLYQLHVAGFDAKIPFDDFKKITKFRFKLVNTKAISKDDFKLKKSDMSFWEFESLSAKYEKYLIKTTKEFKPNDSNNMDKAAKQNSNESFVQKKGTKNKTQVAKKAITQEQPEGNLYMDDGGENNGGTCPKPHGH
jgi:hypothetical protein